MCQLSTFYQKTDLCFDLRAVNPFAEYSDVSKTVQVGNMEASMLCLVVA